MGSIQQLHQSLQALIAVLDKAVDQADDKNIGQECEKVAACVESVPESAFRNTVEMQWCVEALLKLWNLTITKGFKKTLHPETEALLRACVTRVFGKCTSAVPTEESRRQLSVFAYKTARACMELKKYEHAEEILLTAHEWALEAAKKCQGVAVDQEMCVLCVNIFCAQAELAWKRGKLAVTHAHVSNAKVLLPHVPQLNATVISLGLEFGKDLADNNDPVGAIEWLKECHDIILQGREAILDHKRLESQVLLQLSSVYLNSKLEGAASKALECINKAMASDETPPTFAIFMRLWALARTGRPSDDPEYEQGLKSALRRQDADLERWLHLIDVLKKEKRVDVALRTCALLQDKFTGTPSYPRVCLCTVELRMTQGMPVDDLLDALAEGHMAGSQVLSDEIANRFQVILWRAASQCYDAAEYEETKIWYQHALGLFPAAPESVPEKASLLTNLAVICMLQGQLGEAATYVDMALKVKPDDVATHFLGFKVCLQREDEKGACRAIAGLAAVQQPETKDMLAACATLAMKADKHSLGCAAWDALLTQGALPAGSMLQVIRCLIRVRLGGQGITDIKDIAASLCGYLEKACVCLQQLTVSSEAHLVDDECVFFHTQAWNHALRSLQASQNEDTLEPLPLANLFEYAYKVLSLCRATDPNKQQMQRQSLLMAAEMYLRAADRQKEPEKLESVYKALGLVEECKSIHATLVQSSEPSSTSAQACAAPSHAATTLQLSMLEYAAKAHLSLKDDLLSIVHRVCTQFGAQPDTLARMAETAHQAGALNACRAALEASLRLALAAEGSKNMALCSKLYRRLAEVGLRAGERDKVLSLVGEAEDTIKMDPKAYPETEIVWLMTTVWNIAIDHYGTMTYGETERWANAALRLLNYLTDTRPAYEPQMVKGYATVLQGAKKGSAMNC